jgi:cytochrome c
MRIVIAGFAAAISLTAVAPALADGDAANGEKVFRKCKACHTVDAGVNRVGPSLFGIVDRAIATVEGYKYSDAMTAFGEGKTWTAEQLAAFLTKPKDLVPGTKMSFPGIKAETDRADLIAYLATVK